jgi:Lar family restriction alleviation protein|nr:MAG TPA: restriction alleviation protein [Caudoviricetes sp.]
MDELKPCPFCGGEALLEPYRARKGYEASIQCNQCLCSMSTITYDEEETAIEDIVKAWNRRAADGPAQT